MKKILMLCLALAVATPALAGPRHHDSYRHGHGYRSSSDKWVAPLIGGVILGAIINESSKPKETVVVEKVIKQKCEPITVIIQDQWGRTIERRTEERCVTIY